MRGLALLMQVIAVAVYPAEIPVVVGTVDTVVVTAAAMLEDGTRTCDPSSGFTWSAESTIPGVTVTLLNGTGPGVPEDDPDCLAAKALLPEPIDTIARAIRFTWALQPEVTDYQIIVIAVGQATASLDTTLAGPPLMFTTGTPGVAYEVNGRAFYRGAPGPVGPATAFTYPGPVVVLPVSVAADTIP